MTLNTWRFSIPCICPCLTAANRLWWDHSIPRRFRYDPFMRFFSSFGIPFIYKSLLFILWVERGWFMYWCLRRCSFLTNQPRWSYCVIHRRFISYTAVIIDADYHFWIHWNGFRLQRWLHMLLLRSMHLLFIFASNSRYWHRVRANRQRVIIITCCRCITLVGTTRIIFLRFDIFCRFFLFRIVNQEFLHNSLIYHLFPSFSFLFSRLIIYIEYSSVNIEK